MTSLEIPSGRQVVLRHDRYEAVVVEVGGGLRSLTFGEIDVVAGYSEHEMARDGRGQVLAPWPNRIDGGRYAWSGEDLQLPLNEPDRRTAIHGLVMWARWDVQQRDESSAIARYVLPPQTGYPFSISLEIIYRLDANGLSVTSTVSNVGRSSAPFGLSFHPYFTVGAPLDEAVLHIPANEQIEVDERGIPTGRRIAGHPFAAPASLAGHALDECYAGFARDAGGNARVLLLRPGGISITIWMDETFDYLMVYTSDRLVGPEHRSSAAIEPMTCPPNAFRSNESVIALDPGAVRTFRWGIEVNT